MECIEFSYISSLQILYQLFAKVGRAQDDIPYIHMKTRWFLQKKDLLPANLVYFICAFIFF